MNNQKGEWQKKEIERTLVDADISITIKGNCPACSICGYAETGIDKYTPYCPMCGTEMMNEGDKK